MRGDAGGAGGRRRAAAGGLASLLERKGFDIVGQSGDPTELIALVREQRPELAIVDIRITAATAQRSTEPATAARLAAARLVASAG